MFSRHFVAVMLGALVLVSPAALARAAGQTAEPFDGIAAIVNGEVVSIGEVRRAALLAREDTLGIGAPCQGQTVAPAGAPEGAVPTGSAPEGAVPTGSAPEGAVVAGSAPPDAADRSPQAELARAELEQARECLIDARLVFREVRRFPRVVAGKEQLDTMIEEVAARFGSASAFAAEVRRLGLTPQELRDDLRRQLLVAEYVEGRFTATVEITDEQARSAWEQEFMPNLEAEGVAIPSFESVAREYVVPILRQREVNRRVQSWILDLRERATIRRIYP